MPVKRTVSVLTVLAVLSLSAVTTRAQKDTAPKHRLRSPAKVNGSIGGESHSSYVIRAHKGQMMMVEISWHQSGDNRAEFTVSRSPDFFNGGQVQFGKVSKDGTRWSGRIPTTGDYYVYVVGHPSADYTLRVRLK